MGFGYGMSEHGDKSDFQLEFATEFRRDAIASWRAGKCKQALGYLLSAAEAAGKAVSHAVAARDKRAAARAQGERKRIQNYVKAFSRRCLKERP